MTSDPQPTYLDLTNHADAERRKRHLLVLKYYFALIIVAYLYVGVANWLEGNEWAMGDWLINYSAGFVRRGLIGEVALLVGHILHCSPAFLILTLQFAICGLILAAIWAILRPLAWSPWLMLLIFSPATLSYTFSYPAGAFRKEILYQVVLCALIYAFLTLRLNGSLLAALLAISAAVIVLSHEALILFFPYLFCALLIGFHSVAKALKYSMLSFASGGAALLASVRFRGNAHMSEVICSSIGGEGQELSGVCSGAIRYLGRDAAFAHADVVRAIHYWHLLYLMPALAVLAYIPVVMALRVLWRDPRRHFDCWSLIACSAVSWIETIILFLYAIDWNRWLYIHIFSTFMILIFIERLRQADSGTVTPSRLFPNGRRRRIVAVSAFLAYALTWQLTFYHHPVPMDSLIAYGIKQHKLLHRY